MAYLSYQSVDTKLHRYSFVAPQGVVLGAIVERYGTKETVNLFEEFENLTSTHNKNVYELEKSIQREALTMTVLNGLSAFFCLLGLFAQNWVTAIEALKKINKSKGIIMDSYQDFFHYITKDGEEDGPYCIPCSTEGQLNRLIKMEEVSVTGKNQWTCEGCKRLYTEGENLKESQQSKP